MFFKRTRGLSRAILPRPSALVGALLRSPDVERLARPWCRDGDVAVWLSRTTWSLAAVALFWRSLNGGRAPRVWVPDYFCNAALAGLRRIGVELHFYAIQASGEPNFSKCREAVALDGADIFVLVHYFGVPAKATDAAEFCRLRGCWLVEDAAHIFLPMKGVGEVGDFVLYSPHKHAAIPNGAVLVARPGGSGLKLLGRETIVTGLDAAARQLETQFPSSRFGTWIWLVKRILQLGGFTGGVVAAPRFGQDPVPPSLPGARLNRAERKMLAAQLADLHEFRRVRRRTEAVWDHVLSSLPLSPDRRLIGVEYSPYVAVYRVANDVVPGLYEKLQQQGIPVSTWPDLPPEVSQDPDRHSVAIEMRQTRIFIAINQSHRVASIRQAGAPPPPECSAATIDWAEIDHAAWTDLLAQVGQSTLMQSWSYGAGKATVGGWKVRRAIISSGCKRLAVVQVLSKRMAGIFEIQRINRGPLFFPDHTSAEEAAVMRAIGRVGCWYRGRILSIAPEMVAEGSRFVQLDRLRFVQTRRKAYCTVWLDLRRPLKDIRGNLAGKWRNSLAAAEKSGLRVEVRCDPIALEWLIARHEEAVAARQFQGVPRSLLQTLQNEALPSQPLLVLQAIWDGAPASAILVVPHGKAGTYLIGWNGPEGRMRNANHLLLWNAIEWLHGRGHEWFDLGGIDEETLPSVANFKLGLNGARFESIGEYIKM